MKDFRLLAATAAMLFAFYGAANAAGPKQPVISYHLSFENIDFLKDEIIAQSGKKTLDERRIDFP